jgi:hypothetical protein
VGWGSCPWILDRTNCA